MIRREILFLFLIPLHLQTIDAAWLEAVLRK